MIKRDTLGLTLRNIDMTHGGASGIRKILICGAGICYLVILRGEGGIAKKVTALWFILFGPAFSGLPARKNTIDATYSRSRPDSIPEMNSSRCFLNLLRTV